MLWCISSLQPPTLGPATFRPQGWGRGGSGASSAAQDFAKADKDKRPSRYVCRHELWGGGGGGGKERVGADLLEVSSKHVYTIYTCI